MQSTSPMLEAHWETVHHNTSILFFKQAVLSLQVQSLILLLAKSCKTVPLMARMEARKNFLRRSAAVETVA